MRQKFDPLWSEPPRLDIWVAANWGFNFIYLHIVELAIATCALCATCATCALVLTKRLGDSSVEGKRIPDVKENSCFVNEGTGAYCSHVSLCGKKTN